MISFKRLLLAGLLLSGVAFNSSAVVFNFGGRNYNLHIAPDGTVRFGNNHRTNNIALDAAFLAVHGPAAVPIGGAIAPIPVPVAPVPVPVVPVPLPAPVVPPVAPVPSVPPVVAPVHVPAQNLGQRLKRGAKSFAKGTLGLYCMKYLVTRGLPIFAKELIRNLRGQSVWSNLGPCLSSVLIASAGTYWGLHEFVEWTIAKLR